MNVKLVNQPLNLIEADLTLEFITSEQLKNHRFAQLLAQAGFKACITDFCRQNPDKPVVVAIRGSERRGAEAEAMIRDMRAAGITTYSSIRAACRALKRFAAYHAFVAQHGAES